MLDGQLALRVPCAVAAVVTDEYLITVWRNSHRRLPLVVRADVLSHLVRVNQLQVRQVAGSKPRVGRLCVVATIGDITPRKIQEWFTGIWIDGDRWPHVRVFNCRATISIRRVGNAHVKWLEDGIYVRSDYRC